MSRYHLRPPWERPYSFIFAISPDFCAERIYNDGLVQSAPKTARARWSAALLSARDGDFVASWFEVMLFGWLKDVVSVEVVPVVESGTPDFQILLQHQPVFIEPHAHLRTAAERAEDRRASQIFTLLSSLTHPFIVDVKLLHVGGLLESEQFLGAVNSWLSADPATFLLYEDAVGNRIGLDADPSRSGEPQTYATRTTGGQVDHNPLKRPLRKKAAKYKTLRRDAPYAIALYAERSTYSPRDVAAAWFGREQVIIDREKLEVIETRVDRTGIHFHLNEIRHTTVAGTLVFETENAPELGRRRLSAAYIQNPFSRRELDPSPLPLRRRMVVVSRSPTSVAMRWG